MRQTIDTVIDFAWPETGTGAALTLPSDDEQAALAGTDPTDTNHPPTPVAREDQEDDEPYNAESFEPRDIALRYILGELSTQRTTTVASGRLPYANETAGDDGSAVHSADEPADGPDEAAGGSDGAGDGRDNGSPTGGDMDPDDSNQRFRAFVEHETTAQGRRLAASCCISIAEGQERASEDVTEFRQQLEAKGSMAADNAFFIANELITNRTENVREQEDRYLLVTNPDDSETSLRVVYFGFGEVSEAAFFKVERQLHLPAAEVARRLFLGQSRGEEQESEGVEQPKDDVPESNLQSELQNLETGRGFPMMIAFSSSRGIERIEQPDRGIRVWFDVYPQERTLEDMLEEAGISIEDIILTALEGDLGEGGDDPLPS